MTEIHNPQDNFFKKALEIKSVQIDFLRRRLPKKIQDIVDIENLEIQKESFIDDNLKQAASDVLFMDKQGNKYIYLLIEEQSTVNKFMAFRLFKYMVKILDRHMSLCPKSKTLPLVYSMILYGGKKHYTAPTSVWDLFDNSKLAKAFFTDPYDIVDLTKISDEELKKEYSGIMEFLLKYGYERDLFNKLKEIIPSLVNVKIDVANSQYLKIILCYTIDKIVKDKLPEVKSLLNENFNKGDNFMGSIAQMWLQEGIEKGKLEGIQQGMQQGIESTAKKMLKQGLDIKLIASVTGLSEFEILKLKAVN